METVLKSFFLLIAISGRVFSSNNITDSAFEVETTKLPEPNLESSIYYINSPFEDQEARTNRNISANAKGAKLQNKKRKNSAIDEAIQLASIQGLNAMIDLYERKEPEILRKGQTIKQQPKHNANSFKQKNYYR